MTEFQELVPELALRRVSALESLRRMSREKSLLHAQMWALVFNKMKL